MGNRCRLWTAICHARSKWCGYPGLRAHNPLTSPVTQRSRRTYKCGVKQPPHFGGFDLMADAASGLVRTELDIVMTVDDYMGIQKDRMNENSKGRKKRKATTRTRTRWPSGVVPYEISAEIASTRDRNEIQRSVNEWNANTCLNFRPAQNGDRNRIRYVNGNGCSSFVGMIGGTQNVNLAPGCRFQRIISHEMGHAIGFWHEQSRPDRDSFVDIIEGNILAPNLFNFDRLPTSQANNMGVQYDYGSVMHYGARDFTSNGGITVRTLDASFQNRIGNAPGLSFRDFKLANLMYNCNSGCQTVQCPGEGFQAQDCQCRCPTGNPNNPIQVCGSTTGGSTASPTTARPASTTTPTRGTCRDTRSRCSVWAEAGFCTGRFEVFMSRNCRLSCNQCNVQPETCVDFGQSCEFWRSRGYCNMTFVAYMRRNCARTCEVCQPSGSAAGGANENQGQYGNGSDSLMYSIHILLCSALLAVLVQSYALMSPAKDENGDPMVMVEGDIMMKMKEYMDMQKDLDDEEKGRQKRKAIRRTPSRWPNRIIPYEISSEIPASGVNVIRQAIDNWNRNTCLRIRPANSNENNRIRFVQRGGCSSFIGIIGGTQDVTLGRGCLFKRIVEHEIGHAVGFFHEQSRPDRDNFVQIVSKNIQPGLENNFARQPTSTVNNFEVPYDYLSVMHYGATAFGLNRAITVRTVDRAFQNRIGNAPGLSFNDFKLANLMYNCNSGCQSVTCPEEGFQAEDCNCRCPTGDQNNPIRVCATVGGGTMATTTIRPTTQAMNVTCRDNNRNCRFWASQGFCQGIYENFMSTNCKQSCSVCEQQPTSCMDLSPNCEYWQSRGYCTMTFVRYLQTNCAKTCGVCTPQTNRKPGFEQMSPAMDANGEQMVMIEADVMMKMTDYVKMQEDMGLPKRSRTHQFGTISRAGKAMRHSPKPIKNDVELEHFRIIIELCLRACVRECDGACVCERECDGACVFVELEHFRVIIKLCTRIVEHEIGHAVGFYHEQSRPDRDNFVEIVTDNILGPNRHNFEKQPNTRVDVYGVPYDYLSVMHYGATFFSSNGRKTIRTLNSTFQNRIGKAPGLSFKDFKLANVMYNCKRGCQTLRCPVEGFQAEDCNCRCPTGDENNPIRVCDAVGGGTMAPTTPRPTTKAMNDTCMDTNVNCRYWANRGYCTVRRYKSYMTMNCKESCSVCGGEEECSDMLPFCSIWKNIGACDMSYLSYIRKNCEQSCGVCTPRSNQNPGQSSETQNQGNGSSKLCRSVSILMVSVIMAFGARL
ncbi:hypothetical protein FSP39_005797 [Pinctada imbricata]|uniref:Metalloendopeptidase n=1 Tax=Pinctada imbricata TaxID=66713 RepID=A0AA89BIV4_PINIB|nr:hypothetical protein FSP39_005797 [Pinctada imbricata]